MKEPVEETFDVRISGKSLCHCYSSRTIINRLHPLKRVDGRRQKVGLLEAVKRDSALMLTARVCRILVPLVKLKLTIHSLIESVFHQFS